MQDKRDERQKDRDITTLNLSPGRCVSVLLSFVPFVLVPCPVLVGFVFAHVAQFVDVFDELVAKQLFVRQLAFE